MSTEYTISTPSSIIQNKLKELNNLKEKVLRNEMITKEEAFFLVSADLSALSKAADEIRTQFLGNNFDMCSVFSIKGGHCSENCRFCSQSSLSKAKVEQFPLKSNEEILADARLRSKQGIRHYCLVSVGHHLSDNEVSKLCETVRRIRQETKLLPCVSGGLLTLPQLAQLKKAGVVMIHNNLESSRSFFKTLCSSHTYDDKLESIQNAKKAGLLICCGGLFGLGESWEDRIELALAIRSLDLSPNDHSAPHYALHTSGKICSVPINLLDPVPGTPLETAPVLTEPEVRRIIAIFRFLLPKQYIRLAAGRDYLADGGLSCFQSGANAAITGDLLTVMGISVEKDLQIVGELGYKL